MTGELWVARDRDGSLWLFTSKPKFRNGISQRPTQKENYTCGRLPDALLPTLGFEQCCQVQLSKVEGE